MAKKKVEKVEVTPPSKDRKKLKGLLVALTVLVALGLGALIYGYIDAKKDIKRLSNPTEAGKIEKTELVAKVSQLIELPKGEEPTLATVQDVKKLQSQAFFKNAQNGDKVLIYTQSKRAILYRPSTNKVIESAPVRLGDQPSQPAPAAPAQPTQAAPAQN